MTEKIKQNKIQTESERQWYEESYEIEIKKARRWSRLVAKFGNDRLYVLNIMRNEGYDVSNYTGEGMWDPYSA